LRTKSFTIFFGIVLVFSLIQSAHAQPEITEEQAVSNFLGIGQKDCPPGMIEKAISGGGITCIPSGESLTALLIANNDASIPTVTLQTTKSGTVEATLAVDQPYAEKNEFTSIDRYLFGLVLDCSQWLKPLTLAHLDMGFLVSRHFALLHHLSGF